MDDRAFEHQGFFARVLQLEYDLTDRFSFHMGKVTPSFALASLVTPGMFGNSYSKEIKLIDRVGFGGSYRVGGNARASHTDSVNTFFQDTSVFSDSLGTHRGRKFVKKGGGCQELRRVRFLHAFT